MTVVFRSNAALAFLSLSLLGWLCCFMLVALPRSRVAQEHGTHSPARTYVLPPRQPSTTAAWSSAKHQQPRRQHQPYPPRVQAQPEPQRQQDSRSHRRLRDQAAAAAARPLRLLITTSLGRMNIACRRHGMILWDTFGACGISMRPLLPFQCSRR